LKNRIVQKTFCAVAITAMTTISCAKKIPEPATETFRAVVSSKEPETTAQRSVLSMLGKWKESARAFAFVGSENSVSFAVAGKELLAGSHKNLIAEADATVDAHLDRAAEAVTITARHWRDSEQCIVSAPGMGKAVIVPFGGPDAAVFYVLSVSPQGIPITEGNVIKAKRIRVSFSTVFSFNSEVPKSGQFFEDGHSGLYGLVVRESDVGIAAGR
jgi:hypothetical protein